MSIAEITVLDDYFPQSPDGVLFDSVITLAKDGKLLQYTFIMTIYLINTYHKYLCEYELVRQKVYVVQFLISNVIYARKNVENIQISYCKFIRNQICTYEYYIKIISSYSLKACR